MVTVIFKLTIHYDKKMEQKSKLSFINGLIAGAGIALALMSYAMLQYLAPLEGIQGLTTTETRVAILLGGIVAAVAIGYEFYFKNETKKDDDKIPEDDESKVIESKTIEQEDIPEKTELKDK